MATELSNTRLLLVDDDPAWQAALEAKVAKGYNYKVCASGEECIAALSDFKPDIVVLDHDLGNPDLDGLKVLKQIKKELPNTKIIMFTGQEDVQRAVDIINAGAYDYVVKGENATLKVKNILKNIRESERMGEEMVHLRVRIRTWQLMIAGVFGLGLIISIILYLSSCPQTRSLKWDPFGIAEKCSAFYQTK